MTHEELHETPAVKDACEVFEGKVVEAQPRFEDDPYLQDAYAVAMGRSPERSEEVIRTTLAEALLARLLRRVEAFNCGGRSGLYFANHGLHLQVQQAKAITMFPTLVQPEPPYNGAVLYRGEPPHLDWLGWAPISRFNRAMVALPHSLDMRELWRMTR